MAIKVLPERISEPIRLAYESPFPGGVACFIELPPFLIVTLSLVAVPTAVAQVASFQDLSSLVERGVKVVVDTAGNQLTGDVAEISASSLTLLSDRTRHDLDEADVVRV